MALTRLIVALLCLVVWAATAEAQVFPIGPTHVICDSGCGGGTTDTDDGSIAGAQSAGLSAALSHVWSGAAWVRLTQGQATMAASVPVAIASNQSTLVVGDGAGALNVICDSGCAGSGGTSSDDGAAYTAGTSVGTPAMGVYDSTPDDLTDNDLGIVGVTIKRALRSTLENATGTNAFGTAGTASAAVLTVQGVASMTPILATVTATNLDVQIGGSDTVTVTDGAGAMNVIVDSGTVTTVSTVTTLSQFAGNAINLGSGTIGTGTLRTTIATDDPVNDAAVEVSAAIGATAAAVPASAHQIGGTDGTNLVVPYIDPCQREALTFYRVDIVTATTVEIANSVASEFFYICSVNLVTAGANNVLIAEDDTDGCGSLSAGVSSGGTTAGEGWNFAANGGLTLGNGSGAVMKTTTAARYFCLITSAAVQLSGVIGYVSAP